MKSTLSLTGLLITAALLSGCPGAWQRLSEPRALTHGGLERSYRVYVPEEFEATAGLPLVMVLHGGGGRGSGVMELVGFNRLAQEEGFIVVYPDGIGGEWNDGRGVRFRGDQANAAIDDVGFLVAVVAAIDAEFNIDRGRVYVTGASNGGMMSHRVAIEASEVFAAAAPVIGALAEPLLAGPLPALPVPMFIVNGTEDEAVPFEGGFVFGRPQLGALASVEETVDFWREANACVGQPEMIPLPDLDPRDGSRVRRESHTCSDAPVEVHVIEGGAHVWPTGQSLPRFLSPGNRDFNATTAIWEFMQQFARE
jgi:polyhydroxybutyrate depolymerase